MPEAATTFEVREPSGPVRVIDIQGDITAASEDVLMEAYVRASDDGVQAIVLGFTGLDYMNSGGIGLLVTLLVRAQRQHQRVLAFGLSEHYRQIFELTRLDEAMSIHDSEDEALEAARCPLCATRRAGPSRCPGSTWATCPTVRSIATWRGGASPPRSRASGRCGRRPTRCGSRPPACRRPS